MVHNHCVEQFYFGRLIQILGHWINLLDHHRAFVVTHTGDGVEAPRQQIGDHNRRRPRLLNVINRNPMSLKQSLDWRVESPPMADSFSR